MIVIRAYTCRSTKAPAVVDTAECPSKVSIMITVDILVTRSLNVQDMSGSRTMHM